MMGISFASITLQMLSSLHVSVTISRKAASKALDEPLGSTCAYNNDRGYTIASQQTTYERCVSVNGEKKAIRTLGRPALLLLVPR